ncbi:hypothetical protein [Anaerotignum sp.]
MDEKIFETGYFRPWWRVVEEKNGGGYSDLVESGGGSPFLMEKTLENRAFFKEKILRKSVFWGCFFYVAVLQCG